MNNLVFFFVCLNLFQFINGEDLYIKSLDLDYTHVITLLNGNVFIIHKNGVIVYNYNFTIILYDFDFGGNQLISSEFENDFVSIIQCNNDTNNYVLAMFYNSIYVFLSKGKYIFHKSHSFFEDFPTNITYIYYTFLFYKCEDKRYYFIIAFIDHNNFIVMTEFQIEMNIQEYNLYLIKKYKYIVNNPTSDSVSCQILYNYNSTNILSCFYLKYSIQQK